MHQRWWMLVTVVLLALVWPNRAFAHPEILRTEPATDAQLATAPTAIRMYFNEAIEADFSLIQLFNSERQQVDNGGSARSASDPTMIELALPPLGPGVYTVVWQTVGSDGHKVIGNFSFTILPSAATVAPVAAPNPDVQPTATTQISAITEPANDQLRLFLAALLRACMLLGALATIGSWAIGAQVLYRSLRNQARSARVIAIRMWRRIAWYSLLLLLIATMAFILVQTAIVAGHIDLANMQKLLWGTRLGQALLTRLILTILLIIRLAITSRERLRFGISIWLLGGGLFLTFALAGHGAAQPDPFFPVIADTVHVVATSVWVGGLIVLVFALPAVLRDLGPTERVNVLSLLISRFSTIALCSVVALTVSGTYAALLHLNALSDLWISVYGRLLLIKLCLFGGLILLGAYNMLVLRPHFTRWTRKTAESLTMARWQQYFQWAIRSEVVLAIVVIGLVGFLTSVAPPSILANRPGTTADGSTSTQVAGEGDPRSTRIPVASQPFDQTQTVQDLQIHLQITPAQIGENTIRVTLRDANGAPNDIQKVVFDLQMADMEMGVTETDGKQEAIGVFVADQGWLSMTGHWNVRVIVRRSDADDIETIFRVPVGG